MIIAVDGNSASGKGTIAKALAQHFGLKHLDTGLLYRAVAKQVLLRNGDPDNPDDAFEACNFDDDLFADPVLRSEYIGGIASRVSVHPSVRAALFKRQVDFANQPGGAVLDGRDIGTVIAPNAGVKLFVIASAEARANRRYAEVLKYDPDVSFEAISDEISSRDHRDSQRSIAPLIAADDAILIDTSEMTIDEAVQQAIALVEARLDKRHI